MPAAWHGVRAGKPWDTLYITGLQPGVRDLFGRAGLVETIGEAHFFWGADQAIRYAAAQISRQ